MVSSFGADIASYTGTMSFVIKKLLFVLFLSSVVSLEARAASPYLRAGGGVSVPADVRLYSIDVEVGELKQKTGTVFEMAVGLISEKLPIRAELSFSRIENSLETLIIEEQLGKVSRPVRGNVVVSSLMANLQYDISTGTALTPYIKAGIGGADISIEIDGIVTWSDLVLAGQVGGGLAYEVSENLSLDLGYTYIVSDRTSEELIGGLPVGVEYNGHIVQFGVCYQF